MCGDMAGAVVIRPQRCAANGKPSEVLIRRERPTVAGFGVVAPSAGSSLRRVSVRALLRTLEPRDDPRPLALMRIGLGLLVTVHVLALWPLRELLYADDGILTHAEACAELPGRLSLLCHLPDTAVPTFLLAFGGVALALTVGLATRVAAVLATVGFASITLRDPVVLAGDQVFWNLLFLLCLSRCGETWSVDAWWRARRGRAPGRIPGWPRVLMIVQLCVLFGANGWNKHGPAWLEGDVFATMLMHDRWHRIPPWALITYAEPLMRVGTWVMWWFERLFPLVGLAVAARAVLAVRDAERDRSPSRWGQALRWVLRRPLGVDPWLGMMAIFLGTLWVLLDLGWFVPATLVVGLCLRSSLPWTRPWPEPPPRPPEASGRTRVVRATIVTLMLWHSLAMVQGSVPAWVQATPAPLARPLRAWRTATNTRQPWRMFSRGAPRRAKYLHAVGLRADGSTMPISGVLDWHVDPPRPYLWHERRRKVAARILGAPRWQQRYARWLCDTARDDEGEAFEAVMLEQSVQPLPDPRWMAAHGPVDPYREYAELRTVRPLARRSCVR